MNELLNFVFLVLHLVSLYPKHPCTCMTYFSKGFIMNAYFFHQRQILFVFRKRSVITLKES